jgi:hypothetical protein
MAQNYMQFSAVLIDLSEDEANWLKHQLEVVCVFDDKEYLKDNLPEDLEPADAKWTGCRAYRDMEDYDQNLGEDVGFDREFREDDEDWGQHLWLFAEECGDVGRVAHLVQKFLRQFRPDQCWSLTWAATCSKPRVGEFGGGAVFVTASEIKWQDSYEFVEDCTRTFGQ